MSGLDVGVGLLALLIVKHATGSDVWGGLAFTIGFVAHTLARSELFTENFLVPVVVVIARQSTVRRLLRLWGGTFVCNLFAGWVLMWLIMAGLPQLRPEAIKAGTRYVDYGLGWRAFALALVAGLAITLMTWMQHATESIGAKIVAAVMAAFLLGAGGLNHTIVASLVMFSALHAGHAPFGYLDWIQSALWAALGNVVGGVGLVALLRILQVRERLAERRAHPDPVVAGR